MKAICIMYVPAGKLSKKEKRNLRIHKKDQLKKGVHLIIIGDPARTQIEHAVFFNPFC